MKKGNMVATMVLIQWLNVFKEDTTWKELDELIKQFSTFNVNIKDKNCVKEKGIVTNPT
jgi:hypothetical protein